MGYRHISNLYKNDTIRIFRQCYALEKIHGCVPRGTSIRMGDGSTKYIQNIKVGDEVACVVNGALSTTLVTDVFSNGTKYDWLTVKATWQKAGSHGHSVMSLRCTPEHKFMLYADGSFAEAKNLKPGDVVSTNIDAQSMPSIIPQEILEVTPQNIARSACDLETEVHNYITAGGFVVHNSSANIRFHDGKISYFSGCANHENFKGLFDEAALLAGFQEMGVNKSIWVTDMTVYGEVYGGKIQRMSATYGPNLKFVAFEVLRGDRWMDVPVADKMAQRLGIEFVAYELVSTDQAALDAERDRPSRQAIRNGCGDNHIAEGVVLRPIYEMMDAQGGRIICKHKRPEFSERRSKADTVSSEKHQILAEAQAIADEWVTEQRLAHVKDALVGSLQRELTRADIPTIIDAMVEDILREAEGEIVDGRPARKAIGNATAELFRRSL